MTTFAPAHTAIAAALARALAPRVPLTVSQWADLHRRLSSKGSAEPGRWRTDRNPPLREPMDCLSARSPIKDVVLMFPIQFGKTEVAVNALGYTMEHNPGPVMVALPGEVSMLKWINQKLNPMLEETPAVRALLASTASRDGSNRREFKDFDGGQLYLEHAGSPSRLKSTSVRMMLVDELDEFAANLVGGDDPLEMLEGRTSAFPATYKRLFISTPQMRGTSRIEYLFERSDQRRYYVPCPHCDELQPLMWSGLQWLHGGRSVVYICRACGAAIDEHHKTDMIRERGYGGAAVWTPENVGAKKRGYTINCLYYQIGLGPRWADLVERWLEVQGDPAKLKTFVNDRLAEPWEDPTMRAVKHNLIADRAEPYLLRTAPAGVLAITAGVDTQDDRLEVQMVGWGRGMRAWTLDYVVLPGDPADTAVWDALDALLGTPIQSEHGCTLDILATAHDAGGHRTEAVKANIRRLRRRRHIPIFGAVPNNAPVLSKGKMVELNWKGQVDKHGIVIYHVGTVGIKHWLYSRLSTDAEKPAEERNCHFSSELPPEYFAGLVSETYNPAKNRFDKKRGTRNEPLDTFVYAYAATHHPELRLHRFTKSDWDRLEASVLQRAQAARQGGEVQATAAPAAREPEPQAPAGNGIRRLGRVGRLR